MNQGLVRHPILSRAAHTGFVIPGTKPAARVLTRFAIQNLPLSLKNKQRLYNFFGTVTAPAGPLTVKVKNFPRRSISLTLDLRDDLSRNWYYWGYNGYEPGTVRLFKELLKSKSCVFDVGANIGFYTLLAASAMEGRGQVHAFEPQPEVFRCLSHNNSLNGYLSSRLNQMAMSDVDGQELLFLPADLSWTNASLLMGFTQQHDKITVNSIRFDSYCEKNITSKVDLIKIDVEGGESKVLYGMGRLLDTWQPDIICEVLEPYEQELDGFFRKRPYRKFVITGDGLEEVKEINAHPRFRDYYLSCSPISLGRS
jgi:FkbM family methyltransferase